MKAQYLKDLLKIIRHLEDRVLYEIGSTPEYMLHDFEDRAIVAVARGEREWRNTE